MNNSPIYQAQCFGNIEPIEYMVPYPNLRSLVTGQCIKFSKNLLFRDLNITNIEFLKKINKTANWLAQLNIKNGDRILVKNVFSPNMEILSFALWSLGAILVIIDDSKGTALSNSKINHLIDGYPESDIDGFSDEFNSKSNILLNDPAVIYHINGQGIQLSQYNLLINAYGVQKHLKILSKDILKVNLPQNTTASIVLKTILPLYAGTSVSNKNNTITFSTNDDADYQIKFDWDSLLDTKPQSLYILPEATAVLSIGNTPNHLMLVNKKDNKFIINGHSVMMGYLEDRQNKEIFKYGSLIISK